MTTWTDRRDYTFTGASSYELEAGGERWSVDVWVPETAIASGLEVPALYVLDPSATFATTATIVATTHLLSAGRLKPTAVVGVAPVGSFMEIFPKRYRDMTPSTSPIGNPEIAKVHAASATEGFGGADAFLEIVVGSIAAYVEKEHGLAVAGRGIGGWSLGGLLTCHALLTRTSDFDNYLAISPSLWWDDELLVAHAKEVGAGALDGKHIYMGTGELEDNIDKAWPPIPDELRELAELQRDGVSMAGSAQRFAEALAVQSGATIKQELVPGEHHGTIWGAGVTRGVVELYG